MFGKPPRRLKIGEFILLTDKVYEVIRVGQGSATVQPVDARHARFETATGRAVTFDAPAGRMIIAPTSDVERVDPAEVEVMAKKKTTEKKAKPPKAERAPKDPEATKVFAFRLTPAESGAIHKTAGPRNATRFIRQVAAAFANEDEDAFKSAIAEARKLRA
ncbi:MAG: hypothetical protein LAO51_10530 [Acidobacteriia bacterium]|nr:hypothetical protein [Terriglobia bacterium]